MTRLRISSMAVLLLALAVAGCDKCGNAVSINRPAPPPNTCGDNTLR